MKFFLLPRLILFLVTLVAAFTTWVCVGRIIRGDNAPGLYLAAAGAGSLWLMATSLAGLLIKERWQLMLTAFLSGASFLLFFWLPSPIAPKLSVLGILMLILLGGFYAGFRWLRDEAETRLKPRLARSLWVALPRFITPVLLLAAGLYYVYPPPNFSTTLIRFELPRPLFDAAVRPFQGLIEESAAEAALPPSVESLLSKTLPFEIDPFSIGGWLAASAYPAAKSAESLNDKLYNEINSRIKAWLTPYHAEFLMLTALGLFLALKTLSVPVSYLLTRLTPLIFYGLVKLGLIKKTVLKQDQVVFNLRE